MQREKHSLRKATHPKDGHGSWEQMPAPCKVNDVAWSLCYSHYLYPAFLAAWSKGLFTHLRKPPLSVTALALKTGLTTDKLLALVPALALFGVSQQIDDGRITTRGSSGLEWDRWAPMFKRHLADDEHVKHQLRLFSQSSAQTGAQFWKTRLRRPKTQQSFLASLDAHSAETARVIADEIKRSALKTLIDVGSGAGTNAIAALQRCRGLDIVMIDRPSVLRTAKAIHPFARYEGRVTFTARDAMTEPWPQKGDAYLLAHFLQDFGQADRLRLLQQARQAIQPGAQLWIHGHFWSGYAVSSAAAAFAFYLHAHLGGGLISFEQQQIECSHAGFQFLRSVPTSASQQLLIFS